MSGRVAHRYGYRWSAGTMVPRVDVTLDGRVVKRRYGWTPEHALDRAFRWMREHGDPRMP